MQLFKYFPPERVDVLEKQEICFTPPIRFNDPFDLMPVIAPVTDRKRLDDNAKLLQASSRALAKALGIPPEPRHIEDRKRKFAVDNMIKTAPEQAVSLQKDVPKYISKNFGFLCLCENKDSLLMWAHYCKDHKGFVIEFNLDDNEFKNLGKIDPISYSPDRPIIDTSKPHNVSQYLIKSKEWEYESEFRITKALEHCTPRNINNMTLYFAALPHSCIKSVYFGCRIETKTEAGILKAIDGTKIQKFRTDLNHTHFGLVFTQLK